MTRFAVQRCIGNTKEVLGTYETKEEMLLVKDQFSLKYFGQTSIIIGVSESGHMKPLEQYRIY